MATPYLMGYVLHLVIETAVSYPAERKEAILKKMAPPMSSTIPELAEQEGITAKMPARTTVVRLLKTSPVCVISP